jgi:hypothetical protein
MTPMVNALQLGLECLNPSRRVSCLPLSTASLVFYEPDEAGEGRAGPKIRSSRLLTVLIINTDGPPTT